jgi:hypothetical protein
MKIKNLFAIALFTSIVGLTNGNAQEKNDGLKLDNISMLNVNIDESQGSKDAHIKFTESGHSYNIRLKNDKIVEMYIDGKEIPATDYSKYDGLVAQILKKIEENRKEAEEHRAQAKIHREEAEKHREESEMHRKQAEKEREQAQEQRKQAEAERKNSEVHRKQAEIERGQAELERKDAAKHRAQAEIERKKAEEERREFMKLVDDLVEEKVIGSKNDVKSVLLDEEDLYVNGVKQPATLHAKLKAKYLKPGRRQINVQMSGNTKTMSFD